MKVKIVQWIGSNTPSRGIDRAIGGTNNKGKEK